MEGADHTSVTMDFPAVLTECAGGAPSDVPTPHLATSAAGLPQGCIRLAETGTEAAPMEAEACQDCPLSCEEGFTVPTQPPVDEAQGHASNEGEGFSHAGAAQKDAEAEAASSSPSSSGDVLVDLLPECHCCGRRLREPRPPPAPP
eukprot:RCo038323